MKLLFAGDRIQVEGVHYFQSHKISILLHAREIIL